MSQWEKVLHSGDEYTDRMRVDGGWIYKHQVRHSTDPAIGMVFVPDVRNPNRNLDVDRD